MRFIMWLIVCIVGFAIGIVLWANYDWVTALSICASAIAAAVVLGIIGGVGRIRRT